MDDDDDGPGQSHGITSLQFQSMVFAPPSIELFAASN